jgi:hypothetical protein
LLIAQPAGGGIGVAGVPGHRRVRNGGIAAHRAGFTVRRSNGP